MRAVPYVAVLIFACMPAQAQIIRAGPEVPVSGACNPANLAAKETATIASPLDPSRIVVGWNQSVSGSLTFLYYAMSTDGGTSFNCPVQVPFPACWGTPESSGDPIVAASNQTSELLIGGMGRQEQVPALIVAGIPQSQSVAVAKSAVPHCPPTGSVFDKPFMAMGPCPSNVPACIGGESLYVLALQTTGTVSGVGFRSDETAPPGTQWPASGTPIPDTAFGLYPAVLRHGLANQSPPVEPGRAVASAVQKIGQNDEVPTFSTTIDGGQSWATFAPFVRDRQGVLIYGTRDDPSAIPPIALPPVPNSSFRTRGFPSVTTDPSNTTRVFVAFPGREMSESGVVSDNLNLYIAVSVNGGNTFAQQDIYRIDDAQLRLPGESASAQEFFVSVAIDKGGGVNMMFARTDSPVPSNPAIVSLRYARWTGLNRLGFPADYLYELAQFPVGTGYQLLMGTFGNDYQMLTTSSCYVWCAYSRPNATGVPQVYSRRFMITTLCLMTATADFNGDTRADVIDLTDYAGAFAQAAPAADTNQDGAVNVQDMDEFLGALYSAMNGSP